MKMLILFQIFILIILLLLTFVLFCFLFYVPPRRARNVSKIDLPAGKIYEPYWDQMREWVVSSRKMPHEEFSITSFDGLPLYGRYYEFEPGAPVELMFHGYRGSAERDLSGGIHRCFQLGHSALIVDQRCSGKSGGHVITFGIKERWDCLEWVKFAVSHFGPDVKILLTGISMGASTVLMAAQEHLPSNVMGILADCGFHSAKDVILSVAGSMHLPGKVLYPFVRIGAKIFGRFDLEEITVEECVRACRVPVLFIHGEDDDYVPCYMSQINYEACGARKQFLRIPGAGHGLSYPVAPDRYVHEMRHFFYGQDDFACN